MNLPISKDYKRMFKNGILEDAINDSYTISSYYNIFVTCISDHAAVEVPIISM